MPGIMKRLAMSAEDSQAWVPAFAETTDGAMTDRVTTNGLSTPQPRNPTPTPRRKVSTSRV